MISVSNKEAQKIFLTSNTKIKSFQKRIDIIVSPEFYWVRKFEIPVKTDAQARHVLPTLFEDIVNDDASLTYQAIKLEDSCFLCFAYNNKKIYEAIKKSNIPISNISSIYFSQNECKNFNSFEVDNQKFMYTSEGILIKVPNSLLSDTMMLNKVIQKIKPTSHKLQIKLYNDVLSSKYYYYLFTIFIVLIFLNTLKYISYSNEISILEDNIQKIKSENNLPSSILKTDSILKNYSLSVEKQLKKREAIDYIFSNKKFDLKSLNIINNTIYLEYLSVDKKEVENFLSKKYKVVSSIKNTFVLKVSIEL